MGGVVQGEPNFIIFDLLVLGTVILFFIRFFTEKVDWLLGLVALCLVAIWVWLFYYLPKALESRATDPRIDELVRLSQERRLTEEEYAELLHLLEEDKEALEANK